MIDRHPTKRGRAQGRDIALLDSPKEIRGHKSKFVVSYIRDYGRTLCTRKNRLIRSNRSKGEREWNTPKKTSVEIGGEVAQ